jgi:hypothetical protein
VVSANLVGAGLVALVQVVPAGVTSVLGLELQTSRASRAEQDWCGSGVEETGDRDDLLNTVLRYTLENTDFQADGTSRHRIGSVQRAQIQRNLRGDDAKGACSVSTEHALRLLRSRSHSRDDDAKIAQNMSSEYVPHVPHMRGRGAKCAQSASSEHTLGGIYLMTWKAHAL